MQNKKSGCRTNEQAETDRILGVNPLSARVNSIYSITTYPYPWKYCQAFLDYCFCTPLSFKYTFYPVLGVYPIIHVSLSRRTHQLIAEVTLNSKLSFCTAMSMRATTSPESELAVSLIRSVHRWPSLCISAGQKLAKYRFVGNKVLTL